MNWASSSALCSWRLRPPNLYLEFFDRFGPVKAVSYMSPLATIGMVLFATADNVASSI